MVLGVGTDHGRYITIAVTPKRAIAVYIVLAVLLLKHLRRFRN
jgi:hypothetical protein